MSPSTHALFKFILVSNIVVLSHGMSHRRNDSRHHQHRCTAFSKIDVKEVECKLRSQVVPLARNEIDKFYPIAAKIDICSGSCENLHPCIPTVVRNKCVEVREIDTGKRHYREVEEHVECGCCELKAEMCNDKQNFNKTLCECQCIDDGEEKQECEEEGKRWDEVRCICVNFCQTPLKDRGCLPGEIWSDTECSCVDK